MASTKRRNDFLLIKSILFGRPAIINESIKVKREKILQDKILKHFVKRLLSSGKSQNTCSFPSISSPS